MIGGRVLDASALVDVATGRSIYLRSFIRAAVAEGIALVVPATALQDAWAALDPDQRIFLDGFEAREVGVAAPLTVEAAHSAGELGAQARGAYSTTAAHVVSLALQRGWPVLTADPQPLESISPHVLIERLP